VHSFTVATNVGKKGDFPHLTVRFRTRFNEKRTVHIYVDTRFVPHELVLVTTGKYQTLKKTVETAYRNISAELRFLPSGDCRLVDDGPYQLPGLKFEYNVRVSHQTSDTTEQGINQGIGSRAINLRIYGPQPSLLSPVDSR